MARDEAKSAAAALDDNSLDAVTGGASLYNGAEGVDRESWFVNIVTRIMSIPGGEAAGQPQGAQADALFNGDYSEQR